MTEDRGATSGFRTGLADDRGLRSARRRGWNELLEREAEVDRLRAALADAGEGKGAGFAVSGPPGIGKSSLLRTAADLAQAANAVVLRARGSDTETTFGFGVVRQLFEPLLDAIEPTRREALFHGAAGLARPLIESGAATGQDQQGVIHGLFWLTCNLFSAPWRTRARRAIVLAVDDLQWADAPSQLFLLYLLQRSDELPVLLVVTTRPGEAEQGTPLQRILTHPLLATMTLAPLSDAATAQLVRAGFFPDADDDFCAAAADVSGGNPLMLRALLTELDDEGIAPSPRATALIRELVPATVLRSIIARVGRLSLPAADLAVAAAILGDEAPLHRVARLARVPLDSTQALLDVLAAEDILRVEKGVRFIHPLVREAILENVPEPRRRTLRAEAARLLADDGAPTEQVAAHLLDAEPRDDRWVVQTLRTQAQLDLARGAPQSAVNELQRALDEPPSAEQLGEVLVELGQAQRIAGDPQALVTLERAARVVRDEVRLARVHGDIGHALHAAGRPAEALDAFRRALELLGERDELLARELQVGAYTTAAASSFGQSMAVEHAGDPSLEPQTLAERRLLAQLAVQKGFANAAAAEVRRLADAAWSDGQLLRETTSDGNAWTLVTAAYQIAGEFRRAVDIATLAVQDAQRRGALLAFATASYIRGGAAYRFGRLNDAAADLSLALEARRQGWGMYELSAIAMLAWALTEQGALDDARAALADAEAAFDTVTGERTWLLIARAKVRLAEGRTEEALHDLRVAGGDAAGMGILSPEWVRWRCDAVAAHLRLGEKQQAAELVDEVCDLGHQSGNPVVLGRGVRLRGLVAGGGRGVDLLEEALQILTPTEDVLERVRAEVNLGAALRRLGRLRDARTHLALAADLAQRLGATVLVREANEELHAAGARPRRIALSGVDSMTPQERRVADMAAQGMSNRDIAQALFVTPRAIEWHLSNAYQKLAIRSRRELRAALAADNPPPPAE